MAKKKKHLPTVSIGGAIPELTFNMSLDEKKIKALNDCVEHGELQITVKKVDLGTGRIGEAWDYD
jgi:hypothetical protein